jgi:hypothetical protein
MARIPDERHSPAPPHVVDSLREKLADAIRPKPSAAPVEAAAPTAPAKPPRKKWVISEETIRNFTRRDDL